MIRGHSVATQYDPTQLIIESLERLHERDATPAGVDAAALEACRINQPLAVEVFCTQSRCEDVLTADGDINDAKLPEPTVYKPAIRFQFKYRVPRW
jgi:hypothetical protein